MHMQMHRTPAPGGGRSRSPPRTDYTRNGGSGGGGGGSHAMTPDPMGGYGGDTGHNRAGGDFERNLGLTPGSPTALTSINGLGGGAQSTKAVLSALRALQDKIRRLESERQVAVDQSTRLRAKLRQQEISSQQKLEAEVHAGQERETTAQLAVEHANTEKSAMELRLCKVDEEKKALYREIEHLREKCSEAELGRRSAEAKASSHRAHVRDLEEQLKVAELREAEMAQAMAKDQAESSDAMENMKHDLDMAIDDLQGRLAESQQSVEEERGVAVELASKLASAEEMMKNVIAINEFLVQQYGADEEVVSQATVMPGYMKGTSKTKAVPTGIATSTSGRTKSRSSTPVPVS